MDRDAYLNDESVGEFLEWARPLVVGERSLVHAWRSPKWGAWRCQSLFDAYLNYEWRFSVRLPGETVARSGHSLADTVAVLDQLRGLLRESALSDDPRTFLEAAVGVVGWGQVRRNEARLQALGMNALPTLLEAAARLNPESARLSDLPGVRLMNSGFSKIYSLMLDDFPIYDSRVACTLASLVRAHCEEAGLGSVPETLQFGIPASRGSIPRDPSTETLRFPRLWPGVPSRYARSNVMAAWLLAPLSELGSFGELPHDRRLLGLQSALFMLGYAPWQSELASRA